MLFFYLSVIDDHSNDDKFIKLYHAYEKKVFSIAFGFTNNFHDSEDASQVAFFALARNIAKINIENEAETKIYVYKAVKSASFDILRKKNRTPQTISIDSFFNLSSNEDLDVKFINNDLLIKVIKIIRSFPEYYRDVLTYYYLGGYSTKEISDLLSRPLPTVKSQLNRGNRLLRQAIKEAKLHDKK